MKKVLVVDDSPTIRQQVGRALAEAGYEVIEAADGVDGIDKIETDRGIGIVILDINMPRMNGLEMLEKVKQHDHNEHLPVIMLTSEGQKSMIERAKKAGAKGWIVKPFKSDLLVGAVRKLISA
jgi:two-component system, chemotaxis family, chemotaxis protein CheY